MALPSSPPISLNDVYNEAVIAGYSGAKSLSALLAWDKWVNLPVGANSLRDFLGATTTGLHFVQSLNISSEQTTPTHIHLKPDGTKLYLLGVSGNELDEYNLATPWDISSASHVQSTALPHDSQFGSFTIKPDGTKLLAIGNSFDRITEYNLSTAWDISSLQIGNYFDLGSIDNQAGNLKLKSDGTRLYFVGRQHHKIYDYTMSSPWDITSLTFNSEYYLFGTFSGLEISLDGSKMYVMYATAGSITEYNLTSAWDVSTATFVTGLTTTNSHPNLYSGLHLADNDNKAYWVDRTDDVIIQNDFIS